MSAPNTPITPVTIENDRRVLELLSQTFNDVSSASTEIINLEAILNLPKGTEHFVADLHGEHEAFRHILKNASGNIKRKVTEIFGTTMREQEIRELCTLIYYPERKLEYIKASENDLDDFYNITLHQLIKVCQSVSSKYTRSKVRKALPREFAYIIEELLHESSSDDNKQPYFNRIIETIITTGQADAFIAALCNVIQRLSIDQLHILGDIFDRGPGAHIIMDTLCDYGQFDIQWGNHDALWMGAAAGNDCCIANVLRLSLRYGNLATLEDGYGINLVPLATFAMETYGDDPCDFFGPHLDTDDTTHNEKTRRLIAQMHKAISIIQFKLEAALIDKRPEWNMADRKLLEHIDFDRKVFTLDGKDYEMRDINFPTVDPGRPLPPHSRGRGTCSEAAPLLQGERQAQEACAVPLYQRVHVWHLQLQPALPRIDAAQRRRLAQGSRPARTALQGPRTLSPHRHDDALGLQRRHPADEKDFAIDYYWYLWCGQESPLFDKSKMATFERYFLTDKSTHKEEKGYYYTLRDNEEVCDRILDAFGVTGQHRHIINGHVPVRTNKGETPIRANGKLMVIDGGFAKAYHNTTGIAGYTLVYHSRGFQLVQHEPFTSAEEAIKNGTDIVSSTQIVEL